MMKELILPSESRSEAVKRVVAEREETTPSELGCLRRAVDVDDLNDLVDPPIEFSYCGYELVVKADETIIVEP